MNRLSSRWRNFAYLGGILVLLIPIIWLGMPGAGDTGQRGKLAELRDRHDLGENKLGQIDPTSAAMNLVLLGFRGLAADLLWMSATENQEKKDWAELRANVDAIIVLQPHFLKVWEHQGWNLAYNVSAAWDLVADRFYWVKEGAKFLKRGCLVNDKVAQLPFAEGRILGTKIGRADEWKSFRKFFKIKDPNEALFKGRPDPELNPQGKDNYLAAKDVYLVANEREAAYPNTISMLQVLFRGYPWRSQLSYADALQREGSFDELSRTAWEDGYREWVGIYGQDKFQSPGGTYHLNMGPRDIDEEAARQNVDVGEFRHWVVQMQNETRFPYWKTRAQAEAAQVMVETHRLIYDGQQQFRKGNLSAARESLYKGMDRYQQLFSKFEVLAGDDEAIEEALSAVLYWHKILQLQRQAVPDKFPLSGLWSKRQGMIPHLEMRFKRETQQE